VSERLSGDYVARLESLASRFYPGQYVVIDESVDDLIGKSGVRASLVVSNLPGLRPDVVTTVAMVSFHPLGVRGIPESWREVLLGSKERPWRVDLYVPRSDIPKVRSCVRQLDSRAAVLPLPPA
jgi:hypothetical protein